ncbi:MAG: PilZ domain-containing protein [Spirochaetes bacterium]|nr:PilZ domain-containing protein [Spirochaetota bacterium]
MKHNVRSQHRMYLTFYLRVFEGDTLRGFIVDISKSGMMLLSDSPLDEERDYRLSIKLPPCPGEGGTVRFSARCRWSRPDEGNSSFYLSGLEIRNMAGRRAAVIERLAHEYRLT